MPRKRKQDIPTGLPYGDGRRLETHNNMVEAASGPDASAAPAAPQGAEHAHAGPSLLDAARSGPTPGPSVLRPTERPGEPVTSGAPYGPGPNSLGPVRNSAAIEFYEAMASSSGDPYYMHLANLARRKG